MMKRLLTRSHFAVLAAGLILGALGAGRVDTWLDDHRGYIGVQADGGVLIKNITIDGVSMNPSLSTPTSRPIDPGFVERFGYVEWRSPDGVVPTCLLTAPPICPGDR